MKKLLSIIITQVLLSGGIFFLISNAIAIPILQLDIAGGAYDTVSQSIITPVDRFSLYALFDDKNHSDLAKSKFYISCAIIPDNNTKTDFGSFMINGVTVNKNSSGIKYGKPLQLSPHGVSDSMYYEYCFQFDSNFKVNEYNTQDAPGTFNQHLSPLGNNVMYYKQFDILTAQLLNGFNVHFDLYGIDTYTTTTGKGKNIKITIHNDNIFAPYSHDAENNNQPVPEPASLFFLGSGLFGIASVRRKLKK